MTRIDHDRDRRLYEELVRSYGGAVYRFAYRLCGNRDAADDLAQDTFCEAWRSIQSLRDPSRGRAWLFQIVRYRNAHGIRDRSRRVQATADIDRLNQVPDRAGRDVLVKLSDQELLQTALKALDERFKEPFLLVFQEDFICRQAAELLDIPVGTVLSRIHRARQFLRRFVRQMDPTDTPAFVGAKQKQHERNGDQ
jgi:RNA polymerase sigma-70 factor (ECF subfamily)